MALLAIRKSQTGRLGGATMLDYMTAEAPRNGGKAYLKNAPAEWINFRDARNQGALGDFPPPLIVS